MLSNLRRTMKKITERGFTCYKVANWEAVVVYKDIINKKARKS